MYRASALVLAAVIGGCGVALAPQQHSADPVQSQPGPAPAHPKKVATKHLHNVVQVHPNVLSGAQPEGDEAFAELNALGVRTIISVDGAKPDVASARKHRLRYVHLPHGYDGIPDVRAKQLAKAVRDLPGPVYIHCHHGKHRSPAAAAVASAGAGLIAPGGAVAVLQIAGTSSKYRGLFQSAENAHRLDDKLLDALHVEFQETIDVPRLAEAMVAIEQIHDRLKLLASAGWKQSSQHPDLDPSHEALMLREQFAELLRSEEVQGRPAQFQQLAQHAQACAQQLEDALDSWKSADPASPPPSDIATALDDITRSCATCHRHYRDVPLREHSPEQ